MRNEWSLVVISSNTSAIQLNIDTVDLLKPTVSLDLVSRTGGLAV